MCHFQKFIIFAKYLNMGKINFLKIDTEGNDYKVLKGFEEKFKN